MMLTVDIWLHWGHLVVMNLTKHKSHLLYVQTCPLEFCGSIALQKLVSHIK
jgi:hypothetical protein